MCGLKLVWWNGTLSVSRTNGPSRWDCMKMDTGGRALLTGVLFSWASQMTDNEREYSLGAQSSRHWDWMCQCVIAVPDFWGQLCKIDTHLLVDEITGPEMGLHLLSGLCQFLGCCHSGAFCISLTNCCRSFPLQKATPQCASRPLLHDLGAASSRLPMCVRFCVPENICPGWTAWCQLGRAESQSAWSAWHQGVGLSWAVGFLWGRLGGREEPLSRSYWGWCDVFWVFLMSEDPLTHGICDGNRCCYMSAWQIVGFSKVG